MSVERKAMSETEQMFFADAPLEAKIAAVYDEAARNLLFNIRAEEPEAVKNWTELCIAMHKCWPDVIEELEARGKPRE